MNIFASCGVWEFSESTGWVFSADERNENKGGRLLVVDSSSTLENLKLIVFEDFGIDKGAYVELSYLPRELINTCEFPPVKISNDRQLLNFVGFLKKNPSISLCVTIKGEFDNMYNGHVDLNMTPKESSTEEEKMSYNVRDNTPTKEKKVKSKDENIDEDGCHAESKTLAKSNLCNKTLMKGELFVNKTALKSAVELCAMKHNFAYKVIVSSTTVWYIRCENNECNWSLRAECLQESAYFMIHKYVNEHSCAPSSRTNAGKTPSAKTIGGLILHKYEGVKEGPKPNDIVQLMRTDHGCEISYALAWDAREFAVNAVRGIPEKSYGKIPKYLHMLEEANLGTHTAYETDTDGRFRYLFMAFGQSVRGFTKFIRRVIVVDGTFLKSKYKGVLLVATAVDGNSNLYPIGFGIVDSENDRSWDWFMRQLKVVVPDSQDLAFVSDRHGSISKALDNVYPAAKHGICIHHLLNNVVTYFKGKGVAGLVSKASKAYRVNVFNKLFADICNISPGIGQYLRDVDVQKWARCAFPGYRYDIRTTNPAESINAALRSPREYPIIPLLDSIREMLTRWFYKRKNLISKHNHPLTKDVEQKVGRRIEKGRTFVVYPIDENRFLVKGCVTDCVVDLDRRSCTCGKYDLLKIPCRHAIKAGFSVGREPHTLIDLMYTTVFWSEAYHESINPIFVPEDEWYDSDGGENDKVLPPESRRSVGRKRKRRYESVEDKIKSSQGSQGSKRRKCSRCGEVGHNRVTCESRLP